MPGLELIVELTKRLCELLCRLRLSICASAICQAGIDMVIIPLWIRLARLQEIICRPVELARCHMSGTNAGKCFGRTPQFERLLEFRDCFGWQLLRHENIAQVPARQR